MDRTIAGTALICVFGLLGSCAEEDPSIALLGRRQGSGSRVAFAGVSRSGTSLFARRVDSDLTFLYEEALIPWLSQKQWVVATGWDSGTDQSSVLVFDRYGDVIMRHRVNGDAPTGMRSADNILVDHRFLAPVEDRFAVFDHGGLRFIAVATAGMWTPYTIEIVEIAPGPEMVLRARFWNPGSIHTPLVKDGLLVFLCVNNAYRDEQRDKYPVAVGVLDIDRLLASSAHGTVGDFWAPGLQVDGRDSEGPGYLRYFILPDHVGPERLPNVSLNIEGHLVRAIVDAGLVYNLDAATGDVTIDVDPEYERQYEKWRREDPDDIMALDELAKNTQVFP